MKKVLVVDIGGTNVKAMISREERRKFSSDPNLTPRQLHAMLDGKLDDWKYDVVSVGFPAPVRNGRILTDPKNLGKGWTRFNFEKAFGKPVRVINDAAMQALGSYEGGRMLFLGLGTGLGSTLIAENAIVPLELGQLRHKNGTLGEVLGKKGLERLGKEAWIEHVKDAVAALASAFVADYVVLGGGNAKKLKGGLPNNTRLGHNLTAFRGGQRLWNIEHVPTLSAEGDALAAPRPHSDWRVI
jgi:polyphosphate glucokinase